MDKHFIPECYADTVLVKMLLKGIKPNHQKGCPTVIKTMRNRFADDFAVGIMDKDRKELEFVKVNFEIVVEAENLILLQNKFNKLHYIIQLTPVLEEWIITVAKEAALNLSTFGLPHELDRLKKYTKSVTAESDLALNSFCAALVGSNCRTIEVFSSWLVHLHKHNRQASAVELRELAEQPY